MALNTEILNSKEFKELKQIVVLDDVTTSGASMTAACHLLRNPNVTQERYFLAIGRTLNISEIKNKRFKRFKKWRKYLFFPSLNKFNPSDEEKSLFKESLKKSGLKNTQNRGEGNAYKPWSHIEDRKAF